MAFAGNRTQGDTTIVVYVKEPVVQRSYPATRNIKGTEAYGGKSRSLEMALGLM